MPTLPHFSYISKTSLLHSSAMNTRVFNVKSRELEDHLAEALQKCRSMKQLKKTHAYIVKYSLEQSNFLSTKMIDVCDGNGDMSYAHLIFKQVKEPNGYLYNALIRSYTHNTMYSIAIRVYKQMLKNLISPNRFTFPFVMKCCAGLVFHELGKQLHGHLWKFGPKSHATTENAVIDMYAKCDNLAHARKVFDDMCERDVISWNSVISGYVRVRQLKKARLLFDEMPSRSIVSWTAMISGYSLVGSYSDALDVFHRMQIEGIEPDEVSVVSVLPACAQLGALESGKWIHMYCKRKGLLRKTFICNALIEMYAKCGCIEQARQLFDEIRDRDVISWSTMIGGLANHGRASDAIALFERMKQERVEPNAITFVGLLSACAHAGLWNEGLMYFDSMREEHGIEPEPVHYGSLVDVLGRAGQLSQALDIVEKMPVEPDSKIWGSLLSSCRTHRNLEIAVTAMDHLEELEPDEIGNYVLLSNIYADLGKWEGVSRIRKLMRSKSMKKTPGSSLIDVDNVVHEFVSGDDSKPFSKNIYRLLEQLISHQDSADHIIEIVKDYGNESSC